MTFMLEWLKNLDVIAAWGALVSTILAVREYWKSRLKIEIGFSSASLPDIGNKIFIRNNSDKPIIVTYWEVIYKRWKFLPFSQSICVISDEFFLDFQVSSNSSRTLEFVNQDYFSCSPKVLKGRKLYFRLYIAGKWRSSLFFLYS